MVSEVPGGGVRLPRNLAHGPDKEPKQRPKDLTVWEPAAQLRRVVRVQGQQRGPVVNTGHQKEALGVYVVEVLAKNGVGGVAMAVLAARRDIDAHFDGGPGIREHLQQEHRQWAGFGGVVQTRTAHALPNTMHHFGRSTSQMDESQMASRT